MRHATATLDSPPGDLSGPREVGQRWQPALLAGLVLVLGVTAVAARGDDVYLTNGAVFEGVVSDVRNEGVRVRFPMGGGMTLPHSQVLRIEEGESALQQFLRRRERLLAGDAPPEEWLELARWARLNDLPAYREVALRTADLAPRLADLAPLMRGLGYSFDDELGRWIPVEEAMRRRGLVEYAGEWVSFEERAERIAAQRRDHERTAPPAAPPPEPQTVVAETGPTGNEVALAQVELFRDVLGTLERRFPSFVVLGHGAVFDDDDREGGVHPVFSSGGTLGFKATAPSKWDVFLHRQPGSILPLDLDR